MSDRFKIMQTPSADGTEMFWVVRDTVTGLNRGRRYRNARNAQFLLQELRRMESRAKREAAKPKGTGRQIRGWSRQDGF